METVPNEVIMKYILPKLRIKDLISVYKVSKRFEFIVYQYIKTSTTLDNDDKIEIIWYCISKTSIHPLIRLLFDNIKFKYAYPCFYDPENTDMYKDISENILQLACAKGNLELIEYFWTNQECKEKYYEYHCMQHAIWFDHLPIVDFFMVEENADPFEYYMNREAFIETAIFHNRISIVKRMLQYWTNPYYKFIPHIVSNFRFRFSTMTSEMRDVLLADERFRKVMRHI